MPATLASDSRIIGSPSCSVLNPRAEISVCAVREKDTLDSVGVMGSSASRIFLPDESVEHPDTIAQVRMRAAREVRVSVIMGVFDGIAINSARIFGELRYRWVTMCARHIVRAR